MPPQFLFDISTIDLSQLVFDQDYIRAAIPQRGDMEMLNGIVYVDSKEQNILGFKDVRSDEFWVPGHIPGRPLLPGVLMIESAAQLASFYARKYCGWDTGFIGFGGVDECRFRTAVQPPCRLYLVGKLQWHRHGRICCKVQGVLDGTLAFETTIIGVRF